MTDLVPKSEFLTSQSKKRIDGSSFKKKNYSSLKKSLKIFEIETFDIRPDLPVWFSRFLGYRTGNENRPIWILKWLDSLKVPMTLENYVVEFLASFVTILLICAVFSTSDLAHLPVPIIVPPAGAVVMSVFGYPLAPASTPRSLLLGQFWASLTSSVVTRILLDHNTMTVTVEKGEMSKNLVWLAACLSLAITMALQTATNSVHPPGGATAILGCISPGIVKIGFKYVGAVMITTSLILGMVAMIGNSGRRSYPLYWFSPPRIEPNIKPISSSEKDSTRLTEMVAEMLEVVEESGRNSDIKPILIQLLENLKK